MKLAIEIDTSLPASRVIRVMERLKELRGLPKQIRLDNGSELHAQAFVDWCSNNQIELRLTQPGKPDQNAFIERFSRTYRNEALDAYVFEDLEQVRLITEEGWTSTTTNGRTGPWAGCRRGRFRRRSRNQKTPASDCLENGPAYALTTGPASHGIVDRHRADRWTDIRGLRGSAPSQLASLRA